MGKTQRIESPAIGATVTCAETGRAFVVARDGCSVNYAITQAGEILSDKGVHIREMRGLLDRTRPFGCYISSDAKHVTGWKGNELGTIVHASRVALAKWSHWHGSHILHVRVRDVHGAMWRGRGSPGMCVTLRAA